MGVMDRESHAVLKQAAAEAEGLPSQFADRLRGESYGELRRDAKQALRDFGFTTPQPRTAGGQYASFSDTLRAAAGRAPVSPAEQPHGDLGVGRGAGATPMVPAAPSMSDLIRGTANARRGVAHMFAEQLASERHDG
jgi:hypothetical protein